ncbi:hypothetical protein Q5H93_02010 [Hymenobacter sp. ASUV-10]|uniref:Uncharacterized protein n=1 Tax=Hymenobacter aranciens TaxID=3063996 RepID=A0ABT9B708_9BACT|nr:hypothetical protein [Hymenobacter sp. ASUV-10]MDO7873489.1 hypothetical protein [Hymenobacter sp. ASUV-10]
MKPEPPYLRLTLESQATAAFERESRQRFIAQANQRLQAAGRAGTRPQPAADGPAATAAPLPLGPTGAFRGGAAV